MANNDGKYLEDEVQGWADKNATRLDIVVKRLPDTRAARNIIQAQNADFLFSRAAFGAFHLECKSTGNAKLQLNHFRQYPTMRRWWLAGTPGFVLAHFYNRKEVVIVDIGWLDRLKLVSNKWDISGVAIRIPETGDIAEVMTHLMLATGGALL